MARKLESRTPGRIALLVFTFGLLLTLTLWNSVQRNAEVHLRELSAINGRALVQELQQEMRAICDELLRYARLHGELSEVAGPVWPTLSSEFISHHESVTYLEIYDVNQRVTYTSGESENYVTLVMGSLPETGRTLVISAADAVHAAAGLDVSELLLVVSLEDRVAVARVHVPSILNVSSDRGQSTYYKLYDQAGNVIASQKGRQSGDVELSDEVFSLFNLEWRLVSNTQDSLLTAREKLLPLLVILSGVLLSFLYALIVYFLTNQITRARAAEERLFINSAVLEARTKKLEHSNQQLDDFVYAASHDLKSPLRGVENLSKWILEDYEKGLPDPVRDDLRLIEQRVTLLGELLDDLLEYSRVGRADTEPEQVKLQDLVNHAISIQNLPEGFHIRVRGELPTVNGVRGAFSRVFINLITNAIKHNDKPEGEVLINFVETPSDFEFCIEDNGPGIPPEAAERVFKVFQKLKPRPVVEGSGIGLALVKKTVENWGGKVWVGRSTLGGAAFYFTLPKRDRLDLSQGASELRYA